MSRPRSASCVSMISIGAHSAGDGRPLPLRDWVSLVEPWRIARDLRETAGSRRSRRREMGLHSTTVPGCLAA